MLNIKNLKFFRKGNGRYYYPIGNTKSPFEICPFCHSHLKSVYSNKCFLCSGKNADGTIKKKPEHLRMCKNDGYIRIYLPNHHRANSLGYTAQHIVVAEKKIGRKILKNECVHHINHNRSDNREENLQVMTISDHSKLHNPRYTNPMRYGKYFSHTFNHCICGSLKDVRSKRCKGCYRGRFKND